MTAECLTDKTKKAIADAVCGFSDDSDACGILVSVLDDIPSCKSTKSARQGTATAPASNPTQVPDDGVRRSKSGRKLSKYQIHMSDCMRGVQDDGDRQDFQSCVQRWRDMKAQGKV